MKLNEDLIVIKPEEAKNKLGLLKHLIENEDTPDVKRELLTLMSIYLFQTYKPSDRPNSTISDDEWQEFSDWHTAELKGESLTEGSSYSDQVAKMQQLENGTRGFNAKAASDSKLRMNQQICISHNLQKALSIVEAEMIARGLIKTRTILNPQPQPAPAQSNPNPDEIKIHLTLMDFHEADARFVKDAETSWDILRNCNTTNITREDKLKRLLISLIWALCLQKPSGFIQALREFITNYMHYSNDAIKETINECLNNPDIISRLNQGTKDIKNA